ncbi:squalene/phytoene synthase family protein [Limimaricola variabilis]|uniref:squalene/phytoene synthase family protein n=1 Tax=Limimaricola variabilis TaxID=1492771 RepID=UPI002AC905ED|nr:squalene/phytoene synthase family protein [Limimaricola variabilis]WPY95511.1 squalene/phytoene synthase family protein [Limimaricola variabilis]
MSVEACAGLVQRGDPDRFRAAMAAPVSARSRLFPLYAFNLEVARAPFVTKEPMIAEMRLQWWRDVVEQIAGGGPVRAHEVATPLAQVAREANLPEAALDALVAARRWDIYADPFEDQAALDAHLDATAGGLMWLSAKALGAQDAEEAAIRQIGFGHGVALWLMAIPGFEERNKRPLVDGRPEAVRDFARRGLDALKQARGTRITGTAIPALRAAWQAEAVLKRAVAEPRRVAEGRLAPGPATASAGLALKAATGRW